MKQQRFETAIELRPRGGVRLQVPFDPDAAWGQRDRHHVTGTVGGVRVRGALVRRDGHAWLELGPAWSRGVGLREGDLVTVTLEPEGPQLEGLAADVRQALEENPGAGTAFESLPTFYRRGFVRAIEGAKRPGTRARRIADTVAALRDGRREL